MNISLESIDELRARTNLSYKEAKDILEKTDGDVVEALIYMEENEETITNKFNDKSEKVLNKVKDIIKSGNVTKIVLKRDNEVIMNIPVTAGAIGAVFAPTLAAIGIGTAFLTNCTIEISKVDGEVININNYAEDAVDKAKDFTNKTVNKMKVYTNGAKNKAEEVKKDVVDGANKVKDEVVDTAEDIKDEMKNMKE